MADRAYIIPRRNDLDGVNMQVTDLQPNSSQRNLIYDGEGQSGYLKYSFDVPGTTTVLGDSFVSGSFNTAPIAALVDDDTTGGGNDVMTPNVAQFGLVAYMQERVQPGGVAGAGANGASPAEALLLANAIRAIAQAGTALDAATINAALAVAVADTDLDGTNGASLSFGSVEDILRILAGEVYRVPAATIISVNGGGAFLNLASRDILVAAQDPTLNGGTTFVSTGGFLTRGEPGFRDIRPLLISEYVRASAHEGVLAGFAAATFEFLNPLFDYVGTSPTLPRARNIAGTAIPATGAGAVVIVYANDGTVIS